MIGRKEIIYQGFDAKKFNDIRNALDSERIWHSWKTRDRETRMIFPGMGTVRGRFGSAGVDLEKALEYTLSIKAKDRKKAEEAAARAGIYLEL